MCLKGRRMLGARFEYCTESVYHPLASISDSEKYFPNNLFLIYQKSIGDAREEENVNHFSLQNAIVSLRSFFLFLPSIMSHRKENARKKKSRPITPGFEPGISRSVGGRLNHWAMRPLYYSEKKTTLISSLTC